MKRAIQARSRKTREEILVAAETLIAREGVKSLTMEAVAEEAGFSKGAVLHHFRSKDALIAGMVSRELAAVLAGRVAEAEQLTEPRNKALIAVIRHSAKRYDSKTGFPTSLMVAAIENARCLPEVRKYGEGSFKSIQADSNAPEEATILGFAALGLLLSRALGFTTFKAEEGRKLFAAMERMARDL